MAPVTRASHKLHAQMDKPKQLMEDNMSEDIATKGSVTEADHDNLIETTHVVAADKEPKQEPTAAGYSKLEEWLGPKTFENFQKDFMSDTYQIGFTYVLRLTDDIISSASDPATEFAAPGCSIKEGKYIHFYMHNGALYVFPDDGKPWPKPPVQVDPATLGLPYDPETNAEDAALGLLVALPHGQLYNDSVFIKDLFSVSDEPGDNKDRHAGEIRALEFLRKHPHPNFVRYLGCRVIEVPDTTQTQKQGRRRMQKRITGIVLEKLDRSMAHFDPDLPAFRNVDVDLVLNRLENAVLYLHSIGWAHNDLKPSNVMLRTDKQPVLIDYESCARVGTTLAVCGTTDWCLPQNTGSGATSCIENDLYALRLFRERIRDKEAVVKYFRAH